jgi:hypothetical protein
VVTRQPGRGRHGHGVRGRRRQVGKDKTPHIERPSYLGQINPAGVRSSPDRLAEQGAESSEQRPVWGAAGEGWSEYGARSSHVAKLDGIGLGMRCVGLATTSRFLSRQARADR